MPVCVDFYAQQFRDKSLSIKISAFLNEGVGSIYAIMSMFKQEGHEIGG